MLSAINENGVESHRKRISAAIEKAIIHPDPIFRQIANSRITDIITQCDQLASGQIEFVNSEAWRVIYEQLLEGLNFDTYFSVAWMRNSQYWRDTAGRRSIRLNYDLLDRGLQIQRIIIFPDTLWQKEDAVPGKSVRTWLDEQHYRGINLSLVRERDLLSEPELISDFGIYGDRAVGTQDIDSSSRTLRFRLSFGQDHVARARELWNRLKIFSLPYGSALDLE